MSTKIPTHWRAGATWLGWSVLGGLMPLWLTALYMALHNTPISLFEFLKNGEFVLYSASFIGGAMYSIRKDIFPYRNALTFIFVFILAVCVLVFSSISSYAAVPGHSHPISQNVLTVVSMIVFVISTLFCLYVTVAEANGEGVDIPEKMKHGARNLEQRLDGLLRNQVDNQGERP